MLRRMSPALGGFLCSLLFLSSLTASPDSDIAVIRSRLYEEQVALADTSAAEEALHSQRADGSWVDIDYADRSATQWLPLVHLDRLLAMARVCVVPGTSEGMRQQLSVALNKGMGFWLLNKPASTNWWQNEIGQPQRVGPLLILLRDRLPDAQVREAAGLLLDSSQAKAWARTGQNLVWISTGTVYRGCVLDRFEDVSAGLASIAGQLSVQEGEGIQADFSFHQHGPQLYSGGYGLSFLESITRWACLAEGTGLGFGEERKALLAGLVLEGVRWMVRGPTLDLSVRGREIVRPSSAKAAAQVAVVARRLAGIMPGRAGELLAFAEHVDDPGKPIGVEGCRYFWRSDYLAYQSNHYMFSLRMSSSRTTGTEIINEENLLGYWLPFGLTQLMRRGDEYTDLFPVWDWTRLPGVTAGDQVPRFHYQTHASAFVGGASDGRAGVAAMVLNKDGIQGSKAWFVFGDRIMALCAGLRGPAGLPLATSLNQCLLRGPVLMDGVTMPEDNSRSRPARWVHHDGVGYVLDEGAGLLLSSGPESGSWSRLSKSESTARVIKPLFRLWLTHPPAERLGFAYTLLPQATADQTATYAKNPDLEILANTERLQAVRSRTGGLTGVVFFEAGDCSLGDMYSVSVDKPCLLLVRREGSRWTVTASVPAGLERTLHLVIRGPGDPVSLSIELPQGLLAGSSLSRSIVVP